MQFVVAPYRLWFDANSETATIRQLNQKIVAFESKCIGYQIPTNQSEPVQASLQSLSNLLPAFGGSSSVAAGPSHCQGSLLRAPLMPCSSLVKIEPNGETDENVAET